MSQAVVLQFQPQEGEAPAQMAVRFRELLDQVAGLEAQGYEVELDGSNLSDEVQDAIGLEMKKLRQGQGDIADEEAEVEGLEDASLPEPEEDEDQEEELEQEGETLEEWPEEEAEEAQAIIDGTQSILHDAFDIEDFQEAVMNYPTLEQMMKAARQSVEVSTAPALLRDAFFSYFKRAPQLVDSEKMRMSHMMNRQLLENMMLTDQYQRVQVDTAGDDLLASIASVGATDAMLAVVPKDAKQKVSQLERLEDDIERLFEEKSTFEQFQFEYEDQEGEEGEQDEEAKQRAEQARQQVEETQHKIDAAQAQAQQVGQELQAMMGDIEDAARQAVRPALEEAQQEIEDLQQAFRVFDQSAGGGFADSGPGGGSKKMSAQARVALAQRIRSSKKLKQIAEITGRFVRIAMDIQKNKLEHIPTEIVGIKTGDDLSHVLPSELSLLADPDTEDLFFLKLIERKLLVHDLITNEPQGRGPIWVALDSSGSMGSEDVGDIAGRYGARV